MCANFAYRTLTYQGFTKESIYYLTSDINLDLDSNGVLDDVDDIPTNSNLDYAITDWAADADNLVVYITDHGGTGTFRLNETETLSASDLASWLNELQNAIPGMVIIIYDACESGSFLAQLAPPSGKDRIVITSTSPSESAYFITQGTISFSHYFWTNIFNGLDVYDAYNLAKQAISYTTLYQHPLLNDCHSGALAEVTYIGNGTALEEEAPVIGQFSGEQTIVGTSSALLYADSVTDVDGIARVWGVIRPPYFNQGSPDNPVQELPKVELLPVGGERYEGTYQGFTIPGTYMISIYARDRAGDTSVPEITSVNVESPLIRKAVIVAGTTTSGSLEAAIEKNTQLSYATLRFQGYRDEDIYFLSPDYPEGDADALTTLANVTDALGNWAEQDTQDVVLYLIGEGNYGSFKLNNTETLSATYLDSLLDSLQESIPGKIAVIYDACLSGSFLSSLTPPAGKEQDRIVIVSTESNKPAYFLSGGDISFSHFFWTKVVNGSNTRDAFNYAGDAIRYACKRQSPLLEGNGNGIGNENADRNVARYYTIGMGIMLAGDAPVIGSVSGEQTAPGASMATITANNVTTTGTIVRVWAEITPPGFDPGPPEDPVTAIPSLELESIGGAAYEGVYEFATEGIYEVAVYAVDDEGVVSLPKEVQVLRQGDDIIMDTDQDGLFFDNCPNNYNPGQEDAGDGDGVGDVCDNCPSIANPNQENNDHDTQGDICDPDDDNDTIPDSVEGASDPDNDGIPNWFDTDSDGDAINDREEVGSNPNNPLDSDGDGTPDYVDMDSDNDAALDASDNCHTTHNGPGLGTCVKGAGGVVIGQGVTCEDDGDCGANETCDLSQGDCNTNGIGDACECYADCTCDTKVNLSDLVIMKQEFMKTPVYADCNGDGKVDLQDLVIMKSQFMKTGCPACS
jgi:hypothetical protein